MSNRNPVRSVFMTWPQTPITAATLGSDLKSFFKLTAFEIATEKHADGNDHLHAVVQFSNKYSCTHVLKRFKHKYPEDNTRLHVRTTKSLKHSLDYIGKEDKTPLRYGTFEISNSETLRRANWCKETKHSLLYNQDFRKCKGWDISRSYSELLVEYLAEQSILAQRTLRSLSDVYDWIEVLRETDLTVTEYNSIS